MDRGIVNKGCERKYMGYTVKVSSLVWLKQEYRDEEVRWKGKLKMCVRYPENQENKLWMQPSKQRFVCSGERSKVL